MTVDWNTLAANSPLPYLLLSRRGALLQSGGGCASLASKEELEIGLRGDFFKGALARLGERPDALPHQLPLNEKLDCLAFSLFGETPRKGAPSFLLLPYCKTFSLSEGDIGALSHDCKDPLSAILSSAQLLSRSDHLTPRERQYVATILGSCYSLTRIANSVEDLLVLTHNASGQRYVSLDGFSLLRDLAAAVSNHLTVLGVTLHFRQIGSIAPIRCQPTLLERAFGNLVSNAVKFGATELHVTARIKEERLQLTLTDNGVGIDRKDKEQIFRLFFSTFSPKTRRPGCGIGLYLVQRVITGHGGTVSVKSRPQSGTAFCICLPLDAGSAGAGLLLRSAEAYRESDRLVSDFLALDYELRQGAALAAMEQPDSPPEPSPNAHCFSLTDD